MTSGSPSSTRDALTRLSLLTSSLSGSDKIFRLYTYLSLALQPTKPPAYVSTLSTARMVFRLTGIVAVLQQVRDLLTARPSTQARSKLARAMGWVKAVSMLGFYPAEMLYWISSHWPAVPAPILAKRALESSPSLSKSTNSDQTLSSPSATKEKDRAVSVPPKDTIPPSIFSVSRDDWSRYSCQFWLIYILADILDLLHTLRTAPKAAPAAKAGARMMLMYELLDLPLAVTWSTKEGVMGTKGIGMFGTASSLLALYMVWRGTAA